MRYSLQATSCYIAIGTKGTWTAINLQQPTTTYNNNNNNNNNNNTARSCHLSWWSRYKLRRVGLPC